MIERETPVETREPTLSAEVYSPSKFTRALMAGLITFVVADIILSSALPAFSFSTESANRIAIIAALIPAAAAYYFVNRKKDK